MLKIIKTIFWIPVIVILLFGCSGGKDNPITPLTHESGHSSTANTPLLFGLYDIVLDPQTYTAEIVPMRETEFQINVVKFLQPPSGNPANLKIKINPGGTIPSEGLFDLDISITHPMKGSNFRGFDVRGIMLGKATQLSKFDYDVQFPKPDETRLLNADGYTRWWNTVEFITPGLFGYTPTLLGKGNPTGNVNPFKYFCDDLGATDPFDPDPAIRGTFSTQTSDGKSNTLTRNYVVKFPLVGGVPKAEFRYAVCASYVPPDPGYTPPAPIEAYPLEANCPEPYKIAISIDPASTAYYTSTQAGGDLIFNVEVFDWQAAENPDGLKGEIGNLIVESPTLWADPIDLSTMGTEIPTGNPLSAEWQIKMKKVTPTDTFQDIFVTVQSADPVSYAPPAPVAYYPGGAVLSSFMLYTVELPANSAPSIGQISGPGKYVAGAKLTYTLSSMSDIQDGTNLVVTWDFDSDGVFDDDEDGSDTNKKGSFTFPGPGIYHAQCRVTDTQMAYTDSNILDVEEMSLPYEDPMDSSTETLWTVENGIFGLHDSDLQWNVQGGHWATNSSGSGQYDDYMDTMLISPDIPTGINDTITIQLTHKFETENYYDYCQIYYRLNGGTWTTLGSSFTSYNYDWPDWTISQYFLTGYDAGDILQLGFLFHSDSSGAYYHGWDLDHLLVMDNKPPVIEGIYGPQNLNTLGPVTYSTVATDLDGISEYLWSVESDGLPPVYDDYGDGMGSIDVLFPADGAYDIYVQVTDGGNPPLQSAFGPYGVSIFSVNPDAFFSDDFSTDTGFWTFTGGIASGSYQDFWHIDTIEGNMSNLGPDGCFAEDSMTPIEKTASAQIMIPSDAGELVLKIQHRLDVENGGYTLPYDGQWVTIDGSVVDPTFGFLYEDNGGVYPH
ncbi:MAG: hypothetical protein ABIC40_01080, partial [bacterium]